MRFPAGFAVAAVVIALASAFDAGAQGQFERHHNRGGWVRPSPRSERPSRIVPDPDTAPWGDRSPQERRGWTAPPPPQLPQFSVPQREADTPDNTPVPVDEHPIPTSFTLPEGTSDPVYVEPVMGNSRQTGVQIVSSFKQGFASDQEIREHVGTVTMQMETCSPPGGSVNRGVRVSLARADYSYPRIIDGLLLRAAEFAWRECSRRYVLANVPNHIDYFYNVTSIKIYLRNGALAVTGELGNLVYGDGSLWSGKEYRLSAKNVYAEQQQQVAAQQAEQAAADARAQQEQILTMRRAEEAQRNAANGRVFWPLFWLAVIGGTIFWQRERLARWYFMLTPHPGAQMVEDAIAGGHFDRNAFDAMSKETYANPIESEVRAAQFKVMAERMRRQTEDQVRTATRTKDVLDAQEEVIDAARALELSRAKLDLLRKEAGEGS